jgi:hypothetical protein
MSAIEPMILESAGISPAGEATEIVERKGLGHPDTICDAVMEAVAVQLARLISRPADAFSISMPTKGCWWLARSLADSGAAQYWLRCG